MLPDEVVRADAVLEEQEARSLEDLARHRWHWTLDETNPDRVPTREYARRVGRDQAGVARMVKGYEAWVKGRSVEDGPHLSLSECIQRANVTVERMAAAEAVAAARGVSVPTALKSHRQEVNAVRDLARDVAERQGSTVEEEVGRAVESIMRSRKAEERREEQRRTEFGSAYLRLDSHLTDVVTDLRHALRDSEDASFTEEEVEFVLHDLTRITGLVELVRLRVTGETNVDWDAELASLMKE